MDRIAQIMETVHRSRFVRPEHEDDWQIDSPLPIGHGKTDTRPSTLAKMLELLDVQPGQRILDVGTGSGWSTALLATLTGEEGSVIGTELLPELMAFGLANVKAEGLGNTTMVNAEADVHGLPDKGPYDRILVSADPTELPDDLVEQLNPGGIMVIPVAGVLLKVVRGEELTITEHGEYRFSPLILDQGQGPKGSRRA